jgi:uncharacterized protein YdhG (YjbR/CyaY superfamily)
MQRDRSIEEYMEQFSGETREVLEELRAVTKATVPEAVETISYAIPTFDLRGKHLAPYKSGKGSVRLPVDRPLPRDLIRRIVEFRVRETLDDAPSS